MDNQDNSIAGPVFLSQSRVAVLGLGLMGASLSMALKGRCASLMGVDLNEQVLEKALEEGVVDQASTDPGQILPYSDLVILAVPVRAILQTLEDLPVLHPGSAVVIDLGSTKYQIVEAMEKLPKRFDPLGGHPMCGKESSSFFNADPKLFKGAPFALSPLPRSSPHSLKLAEELVQVVGAHPVWIDPLIHDQVTARTSHFPYIVANLLACVTPPAAYQLIGPGFQSTTRVAATPTSVMMDILATNRNELLSILADFRLEMDLVEGYLDKENWEGLQGLLETCAQRRRGLLEAAQAGARL